MYVRLFSEILNSSLMDTSIEARWLFVTMLIIGDEAQDGIVDMPITRLASRAAMTVEQTRRGLTELMEPDINSASKEHDGKRIIPLYPDGLERGWMIVNWSKYKAIASEEARREQARKDSKAYRDRQREIARMRQEPSGSRQDTVRSTSGPTESESTSETKTPKRERGGRSASFLPPTVDEVRKYADEKGWTGFDAESFHAHYETRDWIPKGYTHRMKSWKSAMVTWHKHDGEFGRTKTKDTSADEWEKNRRNQREG